MTTMTKKCVAELEGAQLDWAVGFADGRRVITWEGKQIPEPIDCAYPFSSDWSSGGPIIERERIDIEWWENVTDGVIVWDAVISLTTHQLRLDGPTPLIAAMRAFVASKLGDEVEVPE